MKVLLVTPVYPPDMGGPSLQTQQIAHALSRRGHAVTVLTTSAGVQSSADFALIRLGLGERKPWNRVTRTARLFSEVRAVLRRVKPDLVHMQSCEGALPFIVGCAARLQRVPCLVKFSCDWVWSKLNRDAHQGIAYENLHTSSLRARVYTQMQRRILEQYNCVWATSPFAEHTLREVYGLSPQRIHALPNLIDLPTALPRAERTLERPVRLLLVSRLTPTKGLEVALRALAGVSDKNVRLRIVGDGGLAYVTGLKQLAHDLGVSQQVEWVGAVPPDLVAQEFFDADVFVLPTLYEVFGIVLVQAMAAGLPTVATRVGGVPSIIAHDESGHLVAPGSVEELTAALQRLICNADLRRQWGQNALLGCPRFNLETRMGDLLALYQRTIDSAGERG